MTKKRFELTMNETNDDKQVGIIDWIESKEKNAICIYNGLGVLPFSSANHLCDLLNALHEKNEKLKQVIEEFVENPTQHNLWKLRTVLKGDME